MSFKSSKITSDRTASRGEDISGGYKISSKQAGVEIICDEAAIARSRVAKAISHKSICYVWTI